MGGVSCVVTEALAEDGVEEAEAFGGFVVLTDGLVTDLSLLTVELLGPGPVFPVFPVLPVFPVFPVFPVLPMLPLFPVLPVLPPPLDVDPGACSGPDVGVPTVDGCCPEGLRVAGEFGDKHALVKAEVNATSRLPHRALADPAEERPNNLAPPV